MTKITLSIFLAVAVVAVAGMVSTIIEQPTGLWGAGLYCQSKCFGTEPGEPMIGQETLGGVQLRECLRDCHSGVPYEEQQRQECYSCSSGGAVQKLTAEDETEAQMMCKNQGGADAIITNVEPQPCPY